MKKKLLLIIISTLLSLTFFLFGCGKDNPAESDTTAVNTVATTEEGDGVSLATEATDEVVFVTEVTQTEDAYSDASEGETVTQQPSEQAEVTAEVSGTDGAAEVEIDFSEFE